MRGLIEEGASEGEYHDGIEERSGVTEGPRVQPSQLADQAMNGERNVRAKELDNKSLVSIAGACFVENTRQEFFTNRPES